MINSDKKTLIIIILSIIIIGLIWLIFSGKSRLDFIIKEISEQRTELIRSNTIVEGELSKSKGYNKELETDNIEFERIIDDLTSGSEKTESDLAEYGDINSDFAEFIRSAENTD